MTGELKRIKAGTTTTVIARNSGLPIDAVTGAPDDFENTKDYPRAVATVVFPSGFAATGTWATGTDGPYVNLRGVRLQVQTASLDDAPLPSTTDPRNSDIIGVFIIDDHATPATLQRKTINIDIEGVNAMSFYLENKTGKAALYSDADITLRISPWTLGPA